MVYADMAFHRLTPDEKQKAVPLLLRGVSTRPPQHQAMLLRCAIEVRLRCTIRAYLGVPPEYAWGLPSLYTWDVQPECAWDVPVRCGWGVPLRHAWGVPQLAHSVAANAILRGAAIAWLLPSAALPASSSSSSSYWPMLPPFVLNFRISGTPVS